MSESNSLDGSLFPNADSVMKNRNHDNASNALLEGAKHPLFGTPFVGPIGTTSSQTTQQPQTEPEGKIKVKDLPVFSGHKEKRREFLQELRSIAYCYRKDPNAFIPSTGHWAIITIGALAAP